MNEEKNKKPLLSYEQVMEIINEFMARDELLNRDQRIVRLEKAVEQMEAERKKKKIYRKNAFCRFGNVGIKFFRCIKRCWNR